MGADLLATLTIVGASILIGAILEYCWRAIHHDRHGKGHR